MNAEPKQPVNHIDILREWFGGDRYARDYEYLDANFGNQAKNVAAYIAARDEQEAEAKRAMLEALIWVRVNYAAGSTQEINKRIDAAIAKAEGRTT